MLTNDRIPLRYLYRKVRRDFWMVLFFSSLLSLIGAQCTSWLPFIPLSIPAFLGTAISLLLSFKLNQSYDRWWEARKVWGSIVNDSRTLARQVMAFPREASAYTRSVVLRQTVWCYALGESLRKRPLTLGADDALTPREADDVLRFSNVPVGLLQGHSMDVRALRSEGLINDFERVALDDTLTRLTDSMGKAERIKSTVFPTTYRMFLHGLMYLFIGILTVALAERVGLWTIALSVGISVPFFLLEKTAYHMQDPFEDRPTDTAVTAIAATIERDLREMLGEDPVLPAPCHGGFFLD